MEIKLDKPSHFGTIAIKTSLIIVFYIEPIDPIKQLSLCTFLVIGPFSMNSVCFYLSNVTLVSVAWWGVINLGSPEGLTKGAPL